MNSRMIVKEIGDKKILEADAPFLERKIKLSISISSEYLQEYSDLSEINTYKRFYFNDKNKFIRALLTVVASLGVEEKVSEVSKLVKTIPDEDLDFWIKVLSRAPRARTRQWYMRIGRVIRILYSNVFPD